MIGTPTPEKYLEARRRVEESLKVDPGSAESWALLARLLMSENLNAWNNIGLKDVDRAEDAYKQALAIDPSNAVAHYAAGFVRRVRGDHAGALYEFEKAIELNSNLHVAYAQKANELVFLG
jgi:tetratricopeptide (TPR) repeat protein